MSTDADETRVLYAGRFLQLCERDDWEFVTRTPSSRVVCVVACTAEDEVVLVEQYRRPVRSRVLELPAGIVGDDGDPDEVATTAAARELEEECGYRCERCEVISVGPSSAGMATENIFMVRAHGLQRIHEGGGVGDEDITTHLIPRDQVVAWLAARMAAGVPIDPKVYAGLHFLSIPPSG